MKRILFQTGGPWHPLEQQAELIATWLPADWRIETAFGNDVFDRLDDADLYVAAGVHEPRLNDGVDPEGWRLAATAAHGYTPPTEPQKDAFRRYVASGRPLLAFHGGIVSYPDWPEYGGLLGFRWHNGYTGHATYQEAHVQVATDTHPVVAGVGDFTVHDELYYNVLVPPEAEPTVHAHVEFAQWVKFPMVVTLEGPAGRCRGAGRTAFLANGHTMQSLEPPAIRQIWINTLAWLLGG